MNVHFDISESAVVSYLIDTLMEEASQVDSTKQREFIQSVARLFHAGELDVTTLDFDGMFRLCHTF